MIAAVIFDLDGVLIHSEDLWMSAREEFVREHGGTWHSGAPQAMMGMSSLEWSRYLAEELEVALPPAEISRLVAERMARLYRVQRPIAPGAAAAVRRLRGRWPLALASSANRSLIELVLDMAGVAECFRVTVSSEEVRAGKPAPDVYVETARRLGVSPPACVAIEDSTNGIKSAAAAGMRVIALPNPSFPPASDALALAGAVITSLAELTHELVEGVGAHPAER